MSHNIMLKDSLVSSQIQGLSDLQFPEFGDKRRCLLYRAMTDNGRILAGTHGQR